MSLALDPMTTAVLSCDLQNGIVARYSEIATPLLDRVAEVLAAARRAGAFVAHVHVAFRPGHPEVGMDHPLFGPIKQHNQMLLGAHDTAIHEKVAPKGQEPIFTKHRIGPFLGTDLEQTLRAQGLRTLVLLGVATSGVILSAVRYAADADFRLVVAEDGCADQDAEVHRVLTTKVFPRQGTVVTCADLISAFG